MSEQLVAGLDVDVAHIASRGVITPQAYLALGRLSSKGLEIYALHVEPFSNLAKELGTAKFGAVGLNFAFSVPAGFIEFCACKATRADFQSWQEFVEYLFTLDAQQFAGLIREFKRDVLRSTDKELKAAGPLHTEESAQLTYLGMRNLAGLDPAKFCILPFHDADGGLCSVLEVNSQSTLAALKLLDDAAYGMKANVAISIASTVHGATSVIDSTQRRELRGKIIARLPELKKASPLSYREHPDCSVSPEVQSACVESEHALNAVAACYTAALWVTAPALFADPYAAGDEKVLLEGWTYVSRSV